MKKRFALAVIVITAIALSLVGRENGDGAVVLTTCTVLFL